MNKMLSNVSVVMMMLMMMCVPDLADLDDSVIGVGGGDSLPAVKEEDADANSVIDVCSELIRLAANKAKGFPAFSYFVIIYWFFCCIYIELLSCKNEV